MSKSAPASIRRRSRVNFTSHQLQSMEEVFAVNKYPDYRSRETLADAIGLTEARIQVNIGLMIRNVFVCLFVLQVTVFLM